MNNNDFLNWDVKIVLDNWKPATDLKLDVLRFSGNDMHYMHIHEIAPTRNPLYMAAICHNNGELGADVQEPLIARKLKMGKTYPDVLNTQNVRQVAPGIVSVDTTLVITRDEYRDFFGMTPWQVMQQTPMADYDRDAGTFTIHYPYYIHVPTGYFKRFSRTHRYQPAEELRQFVKSRDAFLQKRAAGTAVLPVGAADDCVAAILNNMIDTSARRRMFRNDLGAFINQTIAAKLKLEKTNER